MVYCPEYFEIIGNRLLHPIDKGERHHIYPKSCGGSNSESNLVMLTAAEHIRCHYLLVDMFQDEPEKYQKMAVACYLMTHSREGKELSEEEATILRQNVSKALSDSLKGKKRKPFSKQHRERMGAWQRGRKLSEETRKRMSEAKKGRPSTFKGKHHSEASKAKISKALKHKEL
jgi:hypothetical protein